VRRISFEVPVDVPNSRGFPRFCDFLGGAWGTTREDAVGPLETLGIGFIWWSRAREGTDHVTLPRPWSLIRNGLVERGALSKKAHVYMTRSEVVFIGRTLDRPRLIVHLERA